MTDAAAPKRSRKRLYINLAAITAVAALLAGGTAAVTSYQYTAQQEKVDTFALTADADGMFHTTMDRMVEMRSKEPAVSQFFSHAVFTSPEWDVAVTATAGELADVKKADLASADLLIEQLWFDDLKAEVAETKASMKKRATDPAAAAKREAYEAWHAVCQSGMEATPEQAVEALTDDTEVFAYLKDDTRAGIISSLAAAATASCV